MQGGGCDGIVVGGVVGEDVGYARVVGCGGAGVGEEGEEWGEVGRMGDGCWGGECV